jgi:hypothetical protein
VVQAAGSALTVQDEPEVVGLLVAADQAEEPRGARLALDATHDAEVEDVLVPERRGLHVGGGDGEVVEDAYADAARAGALRALGIGGLLAGRCDRAIDVPEELLGVTGRAGVAVRTAVAEGGLHPVAGHAGGLDGCDGDAELLGVPGAPGAMAQPGLGRCGEHEAVAVEVAPAAQEDGVALLGDDVEPEDVARERDGRVEIGREQLDVGQHGQRSVGHVVSWSFVLSGTAAGPGPSTPRDSVASPGR